MDIATSIRRSRLNDIRTVADNCIGRQFLVSNAVLEVRLWSGLELQNVEIIFCLKIEFCKKDVHRFRANWTDLAVCGESSQCNVLRWCFVARTRLVPPRSLMQLCLFFFVAFNGGVCGAAAAMGFIIRRPQTSLAAARPTLRTTMGAVSHEKVVGTQAQRRTTPHSLDLFALIWIVGEGVGECWCCGRQMLCVVILAQNYRVALFVYVSRG